MSPDVPRQKEMHLWSGDGFRGTALGPGPAFWPQVALLCSGQQLQVTLRKPVLCCTHVLMPHEGTRHGSQVGPANLVDRAKRLRTLGALGPSVPPCGQAYHRACPAQAPQSDSHLLPPTPDYSPLLRPRTSCHPLRSCLPCSRWPSAPNALPLPFCPPDKL